jgi:hypothetical protein
MSSKRISIFGYRVVRADRKDGKRGGTVSVPTLIDIFATSSPDSLTMFSQLSVSAMNSERDLIYGAHKVCDVAPNQPAPTAQFFRNYNRFDIHQLHNDVLVCDFQHAQS